MTGALVGWMATSSQRLGRILPLFCCLSRLITGITLAPAYWNSSNALFKQSENTATIEVSLYDQIDFVCPYYSSLDHEDPSSYEYYTVYQVTKPSYDSCDTSSRDSIALIVNCSNPTHQKRFTILFEMFQAIPNVPEFVPGNTYYYISTSTGQLEGLANTYLGACERLNMKLVVHVCCDTKRDYDDSGVKQSPNFDIPNQDSITRKGSKSTENEASPKHQGLRNNADSLLRRSENLFRFNRLPCLMLLLSLLFWR